MNILHKIFSRTIIVAFIVVSFYSCTSHKNLIGNARDEHGCLTSAGYQWSEALKDCVRIWEKGERVSVNGQSLILIFNKDSSLVEIFNETSKSILCPRMENERCWISKKHNIKIQNINGVSIITYNNIK